MAQQIQTEAKELKKRRWLDRKMKKSTAHSVAGIMQLIKEVKGQKNEYQDMIEDCISSWDRSEFITLDVFCSWQLEVVSVGTDVDSYVNKLRQEITSLEPQQSQTNYDE